jgi:hypothetical protein
MSSREAALIWHARRPMWIDAFASRLARRLKPIAGFALLRMFTLVAATVVTAYQTAAQVGSPPQNGAIVFRFGATSLTLDKKLVQGQPSPRRVSPEQWAGATQYDMSYGQHINIDLARLFPASLSCGRTSKAGFLTYDRPVKRAFRNPVYERERRPTSNTEIAQLVWPADFPKSDQDKSELYEFQNDDLRDFEGERQLFVHARGVFPDHPSVIKMEIQLAPGISLHASFSSYECFMKEGVALTRHARSFMLERMATIP